jgi:hypothetical protein
MNGIDNKIETLYNAWQDTKSVIETSLDTSITITPSVLKLSPQSRDQSRNSSPERNARVILEQRILNGKKWTYISRQPLIMFLC